MLIANKRALILKGLFYVAAINVASYAMEYQLKTEIENDRNLVNVGYQSLSNNVDIKKGNLEQKVEYTSKVLNNLYQELGNIRNFLQETIEQKKALKPYIVKEEEGEKIIEVDPGIIKIAGLSVNAKFVQNLVKDAQKGLQNNFSQEYFKKNPRAAFSIALGACPAIRENVDKLILSLSGEGFDYPALSKLNSTW